MGERATVSVQVRPSTGMGDDWFISREQEVAFVSSWLSNPASSSALVTVEGIGGMGKSTLLRKAMHLAQQENVIHIWVDGKLLLPVPKKFLDYLAFILTQTYGLALNPSGSTLDEMLSELSERRFVILIDNCDQLGLLEGWFRETFLRACLRQQALVFIASRRPLLLSWKTDLQLKSKIVTMALKPWTTSEVMRYAGRHGVAAHTEIQSILARTGGLPLAVGLAIEGLSQAQAGQPSLRPSLSAWPSRPAPSALSRPQNWLTTLQSILAHLLDETIPPRLMKWLEAISILAETPWDILEAIVGDPLTDDVFRELSRLSIVVTSPTGLSLHDNVRRLMAQELKARDEVRYTQLRQSVVQAAITLHARGDAALRYRLVAHLLELYKDSLTRFGAYDFENMPVSTGNSQMDNSELDRSELGNSPMDNGQMGNSELDMLHSYVRDLPHLSAPSLHGLLDALAKNCPDCIRVIRSEEGEPLAFWICLWLYSETVTLLEKFGPEMLDGMSQNERKQFSSLSREEADTFFALGFGLNLNQSVYTPDQLTAATMHESLPLTATGTRVFFPITDSTLLPFLMNLGFRPQFVTQHPNYTIYQIDGRALDLAQWYTQYFSQIAEPTRDSAHNLARDVDGAQATKLPALAELMEVMKRLEDTDYLHHTALARELQIDGLTLKHRIVEVLTSSANSSIQADSSIRADKNTQTDSKTLLIERYLTGPITVKELCHRHHLSRASLYRRIHEALEALYHTLHCEHGTLYAELATPHSDPLSATR